MEVSQGYQGMRWYKCDLHLHTPDDARHWRTPREDWIEWRPQKRCWISWKAPKKHPVAGKKSTTFNI